MMRTFLLLLTVLLTACAPETSDLQYADSSRQAVTSSKQYFQGWGHVVVLGDSISVGVGANAPISTNGYGYRLFQSLPSTKYHNVAQGGADSWEVRLYQLDDIPLSPSNEDILFVMTAGGNDLMNAMNNNQNVTAAAQNAVIEHTLIADELKASWPNSVFIAADVYDPGFNHPTMPQQYNSWLHSIQANSTDIDVVDIYSVIDDPSLLRPWPDVHPNNAGHIAIKDAFYDRVLDIL